MYVDEDTGDIWFQGETVTDPVALTEVARHSPIGRRESVVKLPAVMGPIVMEAVNGTYILGAAEGAVPAFEDMLRACTVSALHLEMRDTYTPSDPWFQAWLVGDREEFERRMARPWLALIREVTGRGVLARRARIISEPVTEYFRFGHATTESNVAAGEQVRRLPRQRASDLLLPGNDCWIFDSRLIRFAHFSGNGEFLDTEMSDDPVVVKQCAAAFEAVWERALPHGTYQLR